MKKITLIILGALIIAAVPVTLLGMKTLPRNNSPKTPNGVLELLPNGQIKMLAGTYVVGSSLLPSGNYTLPVESNSALANELFVLTRGDERIPVIVGVEFTLQKDDIITVSGALRYAVLAPAETSSASSNTCSVCGAEMPPDPDPLPDNPLVRPLGPAALCPKCGN